LRIIQLVLGLVFIIMAISLLAPKAYNKLLEYNSRIGPSKRKWTDPKETKRVSPSSDDAILNYDTKSSRKSETSRFFKDGH